MHRAVLAAALVAGCNDAVTLEIASDRPVPTGLDAICVGVADRSPKGGQFGRNYQLTGDLASLPQTLRVEPGRADSAWAWVRGDRGGVPVARAAAVLEFTRDLRLELDRCVVGRDGSPAPRGNAIDFAGARLAASQGQGGTVVVAVAANASKIVDAQDGALVATDGPMPPAGAPIAVIAVDIDGDCDDDVIIATDASPPHIWRRDGESFVDAGPLGAAPATAIAVADVDQDGAIDIVVASGGSLALYRNDGTGVLSAIAGAIESTQVTAVTALALADFTGDGIPDLVAGQSGGPVTGWLGQAGGSFQENPGIAPPVTIDVARMVVADVDADDDPDLFVLETGKPMRLWLARDGRLEDQSFLTLPQPIASADAVAVGGWDTGCEPDIVVANSAGAMSLSGQPDGMFKADAAMPPGGDAVMADIDDDGALDAIVAGPGGIVWVSR